MRLIVFLSAFLGLSVSASAQDVSSDTREAVTAKLISRFYLEGQARSADAFATALRGYQDDWQLPVTGVLTHDLAHHILGKAPQTQSQFVATSKGCAVYSNAPSPRETATWSGACQNGKAAGKGTLLWAFFSQGQSRQTSFFGSMLDGKMHGAGTYIQWNGFVYTGEWRDDAANGKGMMIYPSGVLIRGTFVDGQVTGHAIAEFGFGERYDGQMRDNLRHGQGTLTWADGDSFVGAFENGVPHGQGTAIFGGQTFAGLWQRGCFTGDPSGAIRLGTTLEACKQSE